MSAPLIHWYPCCEHEEACRTPGLGHPERCTICGDADALYIEDDAQLEPTLWIGDRALLRRCEVDPIVWAMVTR